MNDLIEKLKHNKTAWKWLSDEEKNCVQGVPSVNRVRLDMSGHWQRARQWRCPNDVIRIHEDYKPEPEIEWMWVILITGRLAVQVKGQWRDLVEVLNHPRFCGYKYVNGEVTTAPRLIKTGKPAEYPTHVGFVKE